jgi:predicted dehydrogenase
MNDRDPIRIGVAGLGKMGMLHAAVFNSLPGSRLTAIAEVARLQRDVLTQYNHTVQTYADPIAMLDSGEVDALVIATPVGSHVPLAVSSIQRGIPFFMEKPLALTAAQGRDVLDALVQKPTVNMVGYMTRFVDPFAKTHEIVASGCLGRLQRVTATIYVSQLFGRGRGWRYDRKTAGGGCLHSQGSHLLDLLTWYFGPVARVNAEVMSIYSAEVEDYAHVMLEFRSGLRAWVDSSWSVRSHRTLETTVDVLGENGSLIANDDSVSLWLASDSGVFRAGHTVLTAPDLYQGVPIDIAGPQYTREDMAFLNAVRDNSPVQPDAPQAYHVQQIIDAAYSSSLEHGAPVWIEA